MPRSALLVLACLPACFSLRTVAPEDALPPPPITCGNGLRDSGESCDGAQLGGSAACVARGLGAGGFVSCTSRCELDLAACLTPDDERVRLWLRGQAQDPPGAIFDRTEPPIAITAMRDGAAQASAILSFSPSVAVPVESSPENERAYELAPGTGHNAFTAAAISVATPITYELWLAPTDATPTDRDGVVFEHENACTLTLVSGSTLRATCGMATATHPTALPKNAYSFVSVQVGRATLTLSVGGVSVTAMNAPISVGSGRFSFANSLTPADGATKQLVGRVDDLRIFGVARNDREQCFDAGSASCN